MMSISLREVCVLLNIALCEDETTTAERMQRFLQQYAEEFHEGIQVSVFSNGVDFLENYTPRFDIVFMDIMMPLMDGMEVAEKLRAIDRDTTLVFVTNMAQYAVKGYEVDALSFLVKPVSYHALVMTMHRAVKNVKMRQENCIVVNTDENWRKLSSAEIRYIEVIGHNVYIHLEQEVIRVKGQSLSSLENQLRAVGFLRCNVGYLVNARYITLITRSSVFLGETELKISRSRKKEFLKEVASYAERSR